MNSLKLTPQQKRQRKRDMYEEYQKRSKKAGIILYELRSELARKYHYKNEKVVEQTIIRMDTEEKNNKIRPNS